MRCRRLDYRYALMFESRRAFGEVWIGKIVAGSTHWSPAADVYETNEEILIQLEIAGADPEKLEIMLYEDALVVAGQRRLKQPSKRGKYHLAEIRQGAFCFELPLSTSFYPEQVESHYENGLLSIRLNKHKE